MRKHWVILGVLAIIAVVIYRRRRNAAPLTDWVRPSMLLGRYGNYNQAGDLQPHTGAMSQAMKRSLAVAHGGLMVDTEPWTDRMPFRNYLGTMSLYGVHDSPVVGERSYNGVVPADLQPSIYRRFPWDT